MTADDADDDAIAPTVRAFASRPEGDALARAVSKARIENLMFEASERVTLGRYHLLSRIGAGGMGTVWGAFDPELDRKVAIKLLQEELAADRERIVLEGKSLAKLAHPNVVTVHDVGVVDEQVYIVMEWIHGKTLREYVRDAKPRDILAAYRAAGEGLAAAHAAGLVHRDFKPDNAMVGDDGRVRVLDFGLARGEPLPDTDGGDTATRGAGTPRYMAPEQAAGGELTPAADQFAFSVSLREALDGQVPKWVQQIIARGTATNPALRYPSMRALLDALAKDPALIWRRRLLAGGAVAAAAAAFAIGSLQAADSEVERCVGGREEIAKVWTSRKGELAAHLSELGPYGAAEASRLEPILDKQGDAWVDAHHGACLARDRGELTPQLYERRLACLARTRAAFGTLIDVLGTVTLDRLPDATSAVGNLPSPDGCMLEAQSSLVAPPPAALAVRVSELGAEIESARTRALALTPDAIEYANTTAARAAELAYTPLIARSLLELGRAYWLQNDDVLALDAFQRASAKALEANEHAIAVEAYALELRLLLGPARPANATERMGVIPVMESIAKGLGPSGSSARAVLYNNIGNARRMEGDLAGSRAAFALALATKLPPQQTAEIQQNLALSTEDYQTRMALTKGSAEALEALLGADHPAALQAWVTYASVVRDPQVALATLRRPCRRLSELHPHLTWRVAVCWFELGGIAEDVGLVDEAREAMSAVYVMSTITELFWLAVPDYKYGLAKSYLLYRDGKYDEAATNMLPVAEELLGKSSAAARTRAALALLVIADCQLAISQRDRAVATLRRAEDVLLANAQVTWLTFYQRYLARVRAKLATLTIAIEPDKARERARAAARWYRESGGYGTTATDLDSL